MPFSYSGRLMYGKRCLAFGSLEELLQAIRSDETLPVSGWVSDSLGKGEVYYNQAVAAPEDTDD